MALCPKVAYLSANLFLQTGLDLVMLTFLIKQIAALFFHPLKLNVQKNSILPKRKKDLTRCSMAVPFLNYFVKLKPRSHEKCRSLSVLVWSTRGGGQRTKTNEGRGPRGGLERWCTAEFSSLGGQRSGQHLRIRLLLLLFLSSSLSSPLCGTTSSSVSPALTGWSPGTQRWAWLLQWLTGSHLEERHRKHKAKC